MSATTKLLFPLALALTLSACSDDNKSVSEATFKPHDPPGTSQQDPQFPPGPQDPTNPTPPIPKTNSIACSEQETTLIKTSTDDRLLDVNPAPKIVPRLALWQGATSSLPINASSRIIIEGASETALSPLATQLQAEIAEILGLTLEIASNVELKNGDIALSLTPCSDEIANSIGAEGYSLLIDDNVILRGNPGGENSTTANGLFYATRSLLQALALSRTEDSLSLPKGFAVDKALYSERSVMLDVARKYAKPEFIHEYIKFMSWYKLNTLHLGLSNNAMGRNSNGTTTGFFRLKTDNPAFAALYPAGGEYYSRADWDKLEAIAAKYAIKIVPEINSPGHSVPFANARPDLAFTDDNKMGMLDPRKPETLDYMKSVFDEFLPWFQGDQVHIGGDELFVKAGAAVNAKHAIAYLNKLGDHIIQQGKTIKIWGDGNYLPEQDKRFIVERWINWNPEAGLDWKKEGYDWIESYGDWYIVPFGPEYFNPNGIRGDDLYDKWSKSHPQPASSAPLGGQVSVWNDFAISYAARNASVYTWEKDVNNLLKDAIPAAGQIWWNGQAKTSEGAIIPYSQLRASVSRLQYGPGVEAFKSSPISNR